MSVRQHRLMFSAVALTAFLALTGCGTGSEDASAPATTAQTPTGTTEGSSPTQSGSTASPEASATGSTPAQEPAEATSTPDAPASAAPESTPAPSATAEQHSESDSGGAASRPTTTAPPGAAEGGAVASVENCTTQHLSATVSPQEGATGSTILALSLTNESAQACKLSGFPGVSFADGNGAMIGVPAERAGGSGATVTVLPGGSASAALKQGNANNYGQVCNAHTSDHLVIYPPENTEALTVPYQTQACGNPKIMQLEIKAFGA
ncbi:MULTISPECIES: DUF4232 domain-containing protein [Kocuria]|uniref:DUF4232 domain-containing protein n=1 Tax=Kocuria subflava TaxID=1736139 RepID=A0A846TH84_9MICC|nr:MULTISPECIES: DUF4232 domain-containing protein [Kocuria]NKE08498.1 DUF4232 domain-containing protein [Kocuria subflava]